MSIPASEWPSYGKIDPELDALLKSMGPQPSLADAPDIPTLRESLKKNIQQMVDSGLLPVPDYTGVKKSTIQIPVRDGSKIPALLYQPEQPTPGGGPLVVLFHFGGWCVGVPEDEEPAALDVVKSHGGTALSVDYRMAPEFVFPVPMEDAWDAVKWAAKNAHSLSADPSKGFIVAGSSAGGCMAATIVHQARDSKLDPPLTGALLSYPHLMAHSALPEKYSADHTSWEQNKDAPGLDRRVIDFLMSFYKPDEADPVHSPLIWPTGHAGLPPHFLQVCGMDPFRDDAFLYERELRDAGVMTEMRAYAGFPHSGEAVFPMLGQARKMKEDKVEGMGWLLRRS